ncbi:hypothetical protein N7532_007879 [Penicillium argentinense]|uniref:Uncharacterized protein n=1 Tax=Penicillium argentinense TaxID=1131581 RepID=A0A9W9EWL9_9EURO|nr:uncharacterized protein N7532_007879 [Penicillium argentinense]KAJ5089195.1 hypothetical protein N7532_007879 [Penicillium argentinense]
MGNFTIVNGQVAIDVSGNGQLPWPPSTRADAATRIHNITLFLTSESLSHNFTISNGSTPANNSSYVGPVLDLEPPSTVKHVNWVWPKCLVGNGDDDEDDDSARGAYNVSMHQSFRWNGTDYYTVFDLPIAVTNSIPESSERMDCAALENELLTATEVKDSSDTLPSQPWVQSGASTTSSSSSSESSESGATMQRGVGTRRILFLATAGAVLGRLLLQ